jgi:hypothetical protein
MVRAVVRPGKTNTILGEKQMPYLKKVSRVLPGLICLILDDSISMAELLLGTSDSKYQWVARLFGILLKEMLVRSTELKGDTVVVKPRYHVIVIIYGSQPTLWGDGLMDIERAVKLYTDSGNSLGLGGNLSGTNAQAAFAVARDQLRAATADQRFRDAFPALLYHLTDGESQTDATALAQEIMGLSTTDGNLLVANAFIGTRTSLNYSGPEDFTGYVDPSEAGPSADNLRLFAMSSPVPAAIHQNLVGDGIFPKLREGARLFFDIRTKEMLKHAIQVVGSLGSRAGREER